MRGQVSNLEEQGELWRSPNPGLWVQPSAPVQGNPRLMITDSGAHHWQAALHMAALWAPRPRSLWPVMGLPGSVGRQWCDLQQAWRQQKPQAMTCFCKGGKRQESPWCSGKPLRGPRSPTACPSGLDSWASDVGSRAPTANGSMCRSWFGCALRARVGSGEATVTF